MPDTTHIEVKWTWIETDHDDRRNYEVEVLSICGTIQWILLIPRPPIIQSISNIMAVGGSERWRAEGYTRRRLVWRAGLSV